MGVSISVRLSINSPLIIVLIFYFIFFWLFHLNDALLRTTALFDQFATSAVCRSGMSVREKKEKFSL